MDIDIQFPLKEIDQNTEKTAEHWFDHFSVEINKVGPVNIPLLNKDTVKKYELVRCRGIISNQLNNEYFNKIAQFRESDDVKQPDIDANMNNTKIQQRYPMILRYEPNQTEWNKSCIYGEKAGDVQSVIAKFYCHTKELRIADSVEIYGIWSPKEQNETEDTTQNQENKNPATDMSVCIPVPNTQANKQFVKFFILCIFVCYKDYL